MIPDFDIKLAYAAHAGTSHSPDARAESERVDYENTLAGAREKFTEAAKSNPAALALVEPTIEEFALAYQRRLYSLFYAKSRTYSAMISGPANYPVARMEKRFVTVRKRLTELCDWRPKALRAFAARIKEARSASERTAENDAAEMSAWRDDLAWRLSHPHSGSAALIAGKIQRAPRSLQPRLFALLRELQSGMSRPVITNRHSIWKLETAAPEAPAATGCEFEDLPGGIRIERDHDEGRVRLIFPDKPDEAMRTRLKGSGWKWSRRSGAWQRMDTNASMQSARYLAGLAVKPWEVAE